MIFKDVYWHYALFVAILCIYIPLFTCIFCYSPLFYHVRQVVTKLRLVNHYQSQIWFDLIWHCYRRRTARCAVLVKFLWNVETRCTTCKQQIAVAELEGYSWPTCSKQPRLVDCPIGVVNKLDRRRRRRVLLTMRSTCCGEFFKSGVWNKVPEGSTLIFGELAEASDKKSKLVGGIARPCR